MAVLQIKVVNTKKRGTLKVIAPDPPDSGNSSMHILGQTPLLFANLLTIEANSVTLKDDDPLCTGKSFTLTIG
jgi:hypothetical protein